VARPRKDRFEETSIDFEKGTEHELVYVSAPFFLKVTYKEKIGKYNNGKSIYGTRDEIVRYLHYTKDEIKKEFQKKGLEVIKFEEATIPLPNICEKCHRKGMPRIERKSNKFDYHPRAVSSYFRESGTVKTEVNRSDEYWLIYNHKTKPNKCRIAEFDKNHFLFKLSGNKISELHKHFFPFYLEWLKKESIA